MLAMDTSSKNGGTRDMGMTKKENQYINITSSKFSRRDNPYRKAKTTCDKVMNFLSLCPKEKMRAIVLDEIGLSEEALSGMPDNKRTKIEAIISNKTEEKLHSSIYR